MKPLKNLLTILLILLPLSAHAWGVVATSGGVAASAGGCATQSTEISQTGDVTNPVGLVLNTQSWGQLFTTTGAISLYSISVYLSSEEMEAGESGTLTIRVGTSANLTTYLGEATVTVANDTFAAGWYEAVFASPISLSATTQYAFGVTWSMNNTDTLYINRSATDVYASNNMIYDITTGSWNLASNTASRDLGFIIKKCN